MVCLVYESEFAQSRYRAAAATRDYVLPKEFFDIGFNLGFLPVHNSQVFPCTFNSSAVRRIGCQAVAGRHVTVGEKNTRYKYNTEKYSDLQKKKKKLSTAEQLSYINVLQNKAHEINAAVSQFIEKIPSLELLSVISNVS